MADPSLGGAPALLVPKFELRVLALALGAESSSLPSPSAATSSSAQPGDSKDDAGKGDGEQRGAGGAADSVQGEEVSPPSQSPSPPSSSSLLLSAAVVESHPMDSDENGICMALVRLEQGGSPRMYVAVGTGMNEPHGEDKAVSGFPVGNDAWCRVWGGGRRRQGVGG